MSVISPTDIAFEGFRTTREKPALLVSLAVFNLLVNFGLVLVAGDAINRLEKWSAAEPDVAIQQLAELTPVSLALLPILLIIQAMNAAAVYRAVLRPEDKRLGFLWLGGDELRLALLTIIQLLLLMLGVFMVGLFVRLLIVPASAAGGGIGELLGLAGSIFALGLLLFAAVRLSLAPAITFSERRISVFKSWAVTRGNFWRLLFAYMLAIVCMIVVFVLAMIVFSAAGAIAVGGDFTRLSEVFQREHHSVMDYLNPFIVAYTVFAAVLNAVLNAVVLSPAAAAYRSLTAAEAPAEA
jgi:hypothetical protein